VGAQPDRWAIARLQNADYARLADGAVHFAAELGELACDKLRGAVLLEAELRVGMDLAPPFDQLLVHGLNALWDTHALAFGWRCEGGRARPRCPRTAAEFLGDARQCAKCAAASPPGDMLSIVQDCAQDCAKRRIWRNWWRRRGRLSVPPG